jgi:hypothetical protein
MRKLSEIKSLITEAEKGMGKKPDVLYAHAERLKGRGRQYYATRVRADRADSFDSPRKKLIGTWPSMADARHTANSIQKNFGKVRTEGAEQLDEKGLLHGIKRAVSHAERSFVRGFAGTGRERDERQMMKRTMDHERAQGRKDRHRNENKRREVHNYFKKKEGSATSPAAKSTTESCSCPNCIAEAASRRTAAHPTNQFGRGPHDIRRQRPTGRRVVEDLASDEVDDIMRYEGGEMTDDDTIAFFNRLYKSGTWRHLQGHYQRMMNQLMDAGLIEEGPRGATADLDAPGYMGVDDLDDEFGDLDFDGDFPDGIDDDELDEALSQQAKKYETCPKCGKKYRRSWAAGDTMSHRCIQKEGDENPFAKKDGEGKGDKPEDMPEDKPEDKGDKGGVEKKDDGDGKDGDAKKDGDSKKPDFLKGKDDGKDGDAKKDGDSEKPDEKKDGEDKKDDDDGKTKADVEVIVKEGKLVIELDGEEEIEEAEKLVRPNKARRICESERRERNRKRVQEAAAVLNTQKAKK